jgi:hypothetical protein
VPRLFLSKNFLDTNFYQIGGRFLSIRVVLEKKSHDWRGVHTPRSESLNHSNEYGWCHSCVRENDNIKMHLNSKNETGRIIPAGSLNVISEMFQLIRRARIPGTANEMPICGMVRANRLARSAVLADTMIRE